MLESLQRIPLPIDLIPEMYRKPLLPDAPQKLRLMAARAALPIPPADLILVLYQLSFDTDGEIQTALTETIRAFDEAILSELAASSLPEAVLDWL
ncbi:MAG: hypothetical protein FWC40_07015, partial [Proteobacteria bacterium]|nr:hypothetical protein [Pseudomonadota bacterium]